MTKKTNENPDYQLTENGLFAYEYPRAAMTADTVIFGFDGEALNVLIGKQAVFGELIVGIFVCFFAHSSN